MDDIARKVGISKRTLYSFFDDKETLLLEGMEYTNRRAEKFLNNLEREGYTMIDVVLLFHEELMKRPRWYSKKFYEDLNKYPRAFQKREADKNIFAERCIKLLNRGIKEGMIQEGINIEILAILAKEQLKMVHPSKSFSNHSNKDVYNTMLITFLRGISTDKGRIILDKWVRTKQVESIKI